jgi:hypothetical protein
LDLCGVAVIPEQERTQTDRRESGGEGEQSDALFEF